MNLNVDDHFNICLSTKILIPTNIKETTVYCKSTWTNPVSKSWSFQYSHLIPDGLICFCGGGSSAGTYPILKENWLNI